MKPIDHLRKPDSWKYTVREAWDRFACARCGAPVHPTAMGDTLDQWDDADRTEYWISGMCRRCQGVIFEETA